MSVYLTVAEAAAMIGVTRQRVQQRIHSIERPIPAADTATPANRNGNRKAIPLETVLEWRAERQAAGQPVGPIPDRLIAAPPIEPPKPVIGIGLPTVRPF